MSSHRSSRRTVQSLAAVTIIALLSACGGSDEASPADDASSASASESAEQAEITAAVESSEDEATADTESATASPVASGGDGSAILTLGNGEIFEFEVRCALEPQDVAGSVIAFTASSIEAPFLDITQFGSEGVVTDTASVSVYDADYNTLWEASTFFDAFGGSIELSLNGSTINGSGAFFPGGDIEGIPLDGIVVANC